MDDYISKTFPRLILVTVLAGVFFYLSEQVMGIRIGGEDFPGDQRKWSCTFLYGTFALVWLTVQHFRKRESQFYSFLGVLLISGLIFTIAGFWTVVTPPIALFGIIGCHIVGRLSGFEVSFSSQRCGQ